MPAAVLPRPDRADPKPLILYHASCPDGFAAALAAWIFYQGQAEFVPQDHGAVQSAADLPALDGRVVYVLDFSFGADILREIDARAARLVLLDHHKSAADRLVGFVCQHGVLHFDMSKSGARLAWDYFLPDRPLPDLVRFVEDRDLWVWQYPQSAAFLAALDMEPHDFARWQEIAHWSADAVQAYCVRGLAMHEKFTRLAEDMAESAQPVCFNGQHGLMLNAPGVFHSLVGDLLSRRCGTFALLWSAAPGGVIKAGLRSQRGYDCIPLAVSMGGGGHAQACGFRMPAERLPELLCGTLTVR